ncbi:MAG: hypothetical protein MJ002_05640 [Paludibacteraceae bacterium]|nr:hypothetical protein [Paludibacteraceae bacterium]
MTTSDKALLSQILQNQTALAHALDVNIPFPLAATTEANPLSLLPNALRRLLDDNTSKVFLRAFNGSNPLFSVVNGSIIYNFKKPALAAYFFGRLFCGDHPERCIDIDIWRQGNLNFPKTLISECFGNLNFRESRQNMLNRNTPKNAQLVDILFDMTEK